MKEMKQNKWKSAFALTAATVLTLSSFLAGCGQSQETAETTVPATEAAVMQAATEETTLPPETLETEVPTISREELEPVTLTAMFTGSAVTPEESELVMAELNKYLQEKINVTLIPVWEDWSSFDEAATAAVQGENPPDIVFTSHWSANQYAKFAADGRYAKLDDLLAKFAPRMMKEMPKAVFEASTIIGAEGKGIYAVPNLNQPAEKTCWVVNGSLLREMGLSDEEIDNLKPDYYSAEFGELLAKAKEVKGEDFYPLLVMPEYTESMVNHTYVMDGMESASVLSYRFDPDAPSKEIGSKAACRFDAPEFENFVRKTYEYAGKGYIDPRYQESREKASEYRNKEMLEGKWLFCNLTYRSGDSGFFDPNLDMRFIMMSKPIAMAAQVQNSMLAIPSGSANTERAVMLLELLNTDPKALNMLNYGLEGRHYHLNNGLVEFDEESRKNYSPWTAGQGNNWILIPSIFTGPDYPEEIQECYGNVEALPLQGFQLDISQLGSEYNQVMTVCEKYVYALMSGAMDPEGNLEAFRQELKEAGVDKVVANAQTQLDAYMK